jgi:hypothetical protein
MNQHQDNIHESSDTPIKFGQREREKKSWLDIVDVTAGTMQGE